MLKSEVRCAVQLGRASALRTVVRDGLAALLRGVVALTALGAAGAGCALEGDAVSLPRTALGLLLLSVAHGDKGLRRVGRRRGVRASRG